MTTNAAQPPRRPIPPVHNLPARYAPPAAPPPPKRQPEKYLKPAEVADQLRVSKMTVYRLVRAGEMRAISVGRSIRIPEKALADYLRVAEGFWLDEDEG